MSVDNEGNRSAGHHKKAKDTQIGGDHYKNMKIEPITFFAQNQTPFPEANTCKYILRHRSKNGLVDLQKARHMIDLMIEEYYPEEVEELGAAARALLDNMEPLKKSVVAKVVAEHQLANAKEVVEIHKRFLECVSKGTDLTRIIVDGPSKDSVGYFIYWDTDARELRTRPITVKEFYTEPENPSPTDDDEAPEPTEYDCR